MRYITLILALHFVLGILPVRGEEAPDFENMTKAETAQYHADQAYESMEKGMYAKAIGLYKKVLEYNPQISTAHHGIGVAYYMTGSFEQGVRHLQTAVQLNPLDAKGFTNLALALDSAGKYGEADKAFRQSLEIEPNSNTVRYKYAAFLYSQNRLDESAAQYEKSLAIDPNFNEAHYWYAKTLYKQDKLSRASTHVQTAKDLGYKEFDSEFEKLLQEKTAVSD